MKAEARVWIVRTPVTQAEAAAPPRPPDLTFPVEAASSDGLRAAVRKAVADRTGSTSMTVSHATGGALVVTVRVPR